MERYLGIDMHRDSCTVVVLSAGGKKTGQQVVPTEAAALVQYVKSLSGELHVCVEEGEWSEWVVEILGPWVQRVVSATAPGRKGPRSDAMDARELAERLRTNQTGPPVYKAPQEWARLRESVRLEGKLLQDEVRAKQRLKSLYRRRGVACRNDEVYSPTLRVAWNAKLPQSVRPSAELLGQELDQLLELQQTAEQQMFQAACEFPMWKTLQTIPGIGRKRAAQLLAIVVTPHRFRTKRLFWSYCGLGVVTRSTSDWVRQKNGQMVRSPVYQTRGLNPACNRQLKGIFVGAAKTALRCRRPNPLLEAHERMVEAGTKPNLARLTIARKIAAVALAMWKTESEYRIMS
jgi:transposase